MNYVRYAIKRPTGNVDALYVENQDEPIQDTNVTDRRAGEDIVDSGDWGAVNLSSTARFRF